MSTAAPQKKNKTVYFSDKTFVDENNKPYTGYFKHKDGKLYQIKKGKAVKLIYDPKQ